jgi:hypothetical protein
LQPGGTELARLAYEKIYNRKSDPEVLGDLVIRDEYLGWMTASRPLAYVRASRGMYPSTLMPWP